MSSSAGSDHMQHVKLKNADFLAKKHDFLQKKCAQSQILLLDRHCVPGYGATTCSRE